MQRSEIRAPAVLAIVLAGQGGALGPLTAAGLAGVAPEDAGAAGGVTNVAHQLGGSLGLAVLVAVFAAAGSSTLHGTALLAHRISAALTVGSLLLALALVSALIIRPRKATAAADTSPVTSTHALVLAGERHPRHALQLHGKHPRELRPSRRGRGDRHPADLVLHRPIRRLGDRPATRPTRAGRRTGRTPRRGLGRPARRRLPRRRARDTAHDRHRHGIPQAQPHHLPHFAVIFSTLIIQGLSLPALIRRLAVSDDGADTDEETRARLVATKAALQELDKLANEDWTRHDSLERLRRFYEYRKRRFAARAGKIEDDGYEDQTLAYQHTLQRLLAAQRDALLRMRSDGDLSNEIMNRVLRELDLEESRLAWRPAPGRESGPNRPGGLT